MSSESQVVQTVSSALEAVEKALEEIKSFDGLDESQIAIATQSVTALEDQLVATRNLLIGPSEDHSEMKEGPEADEPESPQEDVHAVDAATENEEVAPSPDQNSADRSEDLTETESAIEDPLSEPDETEETIVAETAIAETTDSSVAADAESEAETVLSENISGDISETELDEEPEPVPFADEDEAVEPEIDERQRAAQSLIRENNLTLIRGIDEQMAESLKAEGIHTFAQITNFTESDIVYFSQNLKDPGRIARENWIEQAALLSNDIATNYALSLQEMVVETLEPQDNQPVQNEAPSSFEAPADPEAQQTQQEEAERPSSQETRPEEKQETRPVRKYMERPRFDRRRPLSANEHHVHVTNPDWEVKYDEISTELAEDHIPTAMPATSAQPQMGSPIPARSSQPQLFRSNSPFGADPSAVPNQQYRPQGGYQSPSEAYAETVEATPMRRRGLDEPIAPLAETYTAQSTPNPQSGFPTYGGQQGGQQAGFQGQAQSYYQYEAESYAGRGAVPQQSDTVYRGDPQDQPLPEESSKEAIEAWSTYWQEVDEGAVQQQYRQEPKHKGGLRATARRFASVFKRSFGG